ncbi:winged helix DNA-binding domain-containing protein [Nocardioides iriomotensis]|uniref:Winged helix DNA-binding domain-containing protein n=1 Tax=Nocardioides iriomotensis TaxID=715784 RepID=A0A4Q5IZ21_9ACTN|nr:winged helix DNA-binding domain-containing protein [Nocardioides iriomotensis]RYU10331.1 winged helix DNA-binding domain-containing protein [Nocardioides iriomotensis]
MSTLTDLDLARWRLRTQHLTAPAPDAAAVVGHLLCVQAENVSQTAWAVATRTSTPDAADLGGLVDSGQVVRTHVLRPTWHYARVEDIGWLLELTAPRVRKTTGQGLKVAGDLDDARIERMSQVVLDTLAARPDRTRDELAAALAAEGVDPGGFALMLLLADLELQRLLVSGTPRDGTHTYARFEDRVPATPFDRDEALGTLALRYFTGHGPATLDDLVYWATLTRGDAKAGLAAAQDRLASFEHDGRTYWHDPADEPPRRDEPSEPRGHLLLILDELYRGYQDSRMVIDSAGLVPRGRESAIGMAVVDGQMVARMKRTVNTRSVRFELTPYDVLRPGDRAALDETAERYAAFLGLDAEVLVR